jgi:DNA-binding CsgD family transcriptional regulator/tetratricopeptide (TPR) repeat protein
LGDNALARDHYEQALAVSRLHDDKPHIASTLRGLGNLAIDRGEFALALELLREGHDVAQDCGNDWEVGATSNLIGLVHAAQGDVSTALELYETAARAWRALGDRGHVTSALGSAAWSAMQAREIGRAAVDYAEAMENARGDEDAWYIAWCVLGAGGIEAALGHAPEATALLACGMQARAALGMPLRPHVQAGFDQIGETLRKRLGGDAFTTAWKEGLALPIEEAADRAQAVFAAITRDGSTTDIPFGLTRREHDVLRLLADGHPDKEIATMLFIGLRTASSHVAAIMAKLGVDSRTAAVARAIRLGLA